MNFPSQHELNSHSAMNENASGPCQIDFEQEIEVRDCEDVGSCFFCGKPLSILEYGQHDSSVFAVTCSDGDNCFVNFFFPNFSTKAEAKAVIETSRRFTSHFGLTNREAASVRLHAPRWKRVLNFLFRPSDFDYFFIFVLSNAFLTGFFGFLFGTPLSFFLLLKISLPFSLSIFMLFIFFRAFVKFLRIELDSISKQ